MARRDLAAEPPVTAGFTLLEVVVALLIFALSFGVLAQIFQTGLQQSARAEAVTAATLLARSEVARIGVEAELLVGETRFETDDGYRIRTRVAPAEFEADEDQQIMPLVVEVAVAWGPPASGRQVTLTTMRLAPTAPDDDR